jgi:hypothetical protein
MMYWEDLKNKGDFCDTTPRCSWSIEKDSWCPLSEVSSVDRDRSTKQKVQQLVQDIR